MKNNMGMIDRVIRTLIALTIAVLFYLEVITGTLGIVLLILGGVFLLTSIVGICPLYLPFGIKTCKAKK
jgi:hypothetical protein